MQRIRAFLNQFRFELAIAAGTFVTGSVGYALTGIKFPNDDQFILYRYIDHIASGNGFTWNYGEKVLGATTPLFTLVCAFVKFIFLSIPTPTLVACVNILLLSIASIFFYRVSKHFLSNKWSLIMSVIFMLNLARAIPEGMETPLFLLTTFAFLDFLFREKYYPSAVFLALAILTRPDAGLIAVLAGIFWWQKKGLKEAVKLTVASLLVALPWFAFATWYFGSFIPQSLITKTHGHDIYNIPAVQAFKIQLASVSRILWGKVFDPEQIPLQILVNLAPILVMVGIGIKKQLSRNNWILFAIPFVYFISFSLSNPLMFPWYLSQMEPFWILMIGMGAMAIAEKIKPKMWKCLFIALLLLGPIWFWIAGMMSQASTSKIALFEASAYLKTNAQSTDTIGISNIGIVGYLVDLETIDFIGLVRNESVAYYPIKDDCPPSDQLYTIPPKLIEDTKPTWIVAGDGEMQTCFLNGSWFREHYSQAWRYQDSTLRIWKRL